MTQLWSNLTREERIALVREHHTRDSSAAAIARSIGQGVTRNAVVGVYHRCPALKLSHPLGGSNHGVVGKGKSVSMDPMAKPRIVMRVHKQELVPQFREGPEMIPSPPRPAPKSAPESRSLTLAELSSGECKWPEGDRDFTFCGAPAEGSYCAYHKRLSWAPPRERVAR